MDKYKKDDYINCKFVEKIEEYNTDSFEEKMGFLEDFIQFVANSNPDYLYNKTYLRRFYSPFTNFVRNLKVSMLFIREFVAVLCKKMESGENVTLSFYEYIFFKPMQQNMEFDNELITIGKKIPDVLISDNLKKIYIDCILINGDKKYCYAEEVDLYDEKAKILDYGQIDDKAKQFYCNVKGIKNDNI